MAKRNYSWKDNGKADEMKGDVFIFSYQTSFRNLCDSGVDMGVTQEEERIGPKRIGPNLCTTDLRRDLNIYWLK